MRELRAVVKDQGECLSKAQHDLADMRLELLNNLSKHLKDQLGSGVSNVTFLDQRRSFGVPR